MSAFTNQLDLDLVITSPTGLHLMPSLFILAAGKDLLTD